MSLYGALAENTRLNERVARGKITFTGSGTIGFTASQTVNILPPAGAMGGMRFMTNFLLTIDDTTGVLGTGGVSTGIVGTGTAVVSGSLNAAGTILTILSYSFTSTSNPTLIASTTAVTVRYAIWGNLSALTGAGTGGPGGTF
jgi:hypothetical protein